MVSKIKENFLTIDYHKSFYIQEKKIETKRDVCLGVYKRIIKSVTQVRTQ
jgi:hypothetical protein